MNILLFAPALFLAYLGTQGFLGTIKQLTICASVQLALAYPFLSTYPWSYLKVSIYLKYSQVFIFKVFNVIFKIRRWFLLILSIKIILIHKKLRVKIVDLKVKIFYCKFYRV